MKYRIITLLITFLFAGCNMTPEQKARMDTQFELMQMENRMSMIELQHTFDEIDKAGSGRF